MDLAKDKRPNQEKRRKGRKCSGVITCCIGEAESPVAQALEAYCLVNEKTVSEAVRKMIYFTLRSKGYLQS